jgi:hypothetical protein
VRDDVSTLRTALDAVSHDIPGYNGGATVPSPTGVQQKISGTNTAIAKVISAANSDIDQVNAAVATAYQYAATASATNDCGTGSTPPAQVEHIS